MALDKYLLEDGTGGYQTEDAAGNLLLEFQAAELLAVTLAALLASYCPPSVRPNHAKVYQEQTAPQPAWITQPVNNDLARFWPGIESGRFADYVPPRRIEPRNAYVTLTEPRYPTPSPSLAVALTVPPSGQQAIATYLLAQPRVAALRVASDKTYIQQTRPSDGWNPAEDAALAIVWPSIECGTGRASYTTPTRISDRTYLEQLPRYPTPFSTFEGVLWAPLGDQPRNSYRVAERSRDVRPTQTLDGWIFPNLSTGPTVDQTLPAFQQQASYVTPKRPPDIGSLYRHSRYENPIGLVNPLIVVAVTAQGVSSYIAPARVQDRTYFQQESRYPTPFPIYSFWPGIAQPSSFRIADRARIDVRSTQVHYPTPVPFFDFAIYVPIADAQRSGGRSADRNLAPIATTATWPIPVPATFDPTVTVGPVSQESFGFRLGDRDLGQRNLLLLTQSLDGWQARVVDAKNAVTFPATQIASFRSGDRNLTPIATVATWPVVAPAAAFDVTTTVAPIAQEASGFRTGARANAAIECQPQPNFEGAVVTPEAYEYPPVGDEQRNASYRTLARSVDVRNTEPNAGWVYGSVAASLQATWPAVEQGTDRDYRTPKRADAPIPTRPNDGWGYAPATASVPANAPAIAIESYRMRDRAQAAIPTTPQINVEGAVATPEAYEYVAVADAQRNGSYRTAARSVDVRPTTPLDGWQYAPATANLGAYWPGVEEELRSYRMPNRASDKTFLQQTTPEPNYFVATAPWEAIGNVAINDEQRNASYLIPKRSTDVRPTTPLDGWGEEEAEAVEATFAPVWAQEASGFRLANRRQDRTFILQGQPEINVEGAVVTPEAYEFSPVDAQERSGFRAADRQSDKTYLQQTTPEDGWRYPVVAAALAAPWPGIEQVTRTYRTPDSRADRYFIEQTQPEIAFLYIAIQPFEVTTYTAIGYQQRSSFLSRLRSTDVRPTQPNDGWQYAPSTAVLPSWTPIWNEQAVAAYLSRLRSQDVRPTTPNEGWVYATATANLPTFVPARDAERNPYRVAKRPDAAIQTSPLSGWEATAVANAVAQQSPARVQEAGGFRTPDRAQDKTFIRQDQPELAWQDAVLDITETNTQVPIFDQQRNASYLPKLRSVDVRPTVPNDGWIARPVNIDLGKFWPAQTTPDYRMADRYFDILRLQTAPSQAWIGQQVDRAFAPLAPIWAQEAAGFRAADRRQDRTFIEQTAPGFDWVYLPSLPPLPPTSSILDGQRNGSYRSEAAPPDRLWFQTAPSFGWFYDASIAQVPEFWPAFEQGLRSYRMEDRPFDVLRLPTIPLWVVHPPDINIYPQPLPPCKWIYVQQLRRLDWVERDRPTLITVARLFRTFIIEE